MALKFPDILQHNNSNYALIDSSQVRGTAYGITNLSDTGSIPSDKRNTGIIVFVSSEQKYYGYYGTTIGSTDWNNTDNWKPLADGDNAISLGVITTGSANTNQTISGSLTVTQNIFGSASFATQSLSSSYSLTSSFTPNAIITASVSSNIITFRKGDSSSFTITVDTGSNSAESLLSGITTGQLLYNNSSTFAGVPTLTYNGTILTVTGSFTGSLTGSLFGTASWSQTASNSINANTSSFAFNSISSSYPFNVTGSTIYSWNSNISQSSKLNVTPNHSFIVGERAGIDVEIDANYVGFGPTINSHSIMIGYEAGYASILSANNIFLGNNAGQYSFGVSHSFFALEGSGKETNTNNSIFIGYWSGQQAFSANNSVFLGRLSGYQSQNSSYSTFIGYNSGRAIGLGPGDNNIIIGTNITLPDNTINSINFGGILFGSGSYSTKTGNPRSTALSTGRIGVNIYPRNYNFEVNGTTNISNGLYVTNSINLSGSNNHTGNYILTGSINSTGSNTFIGNTIISGSLLTSGSNTFNGLQTISGSLNVMQDLTVLGSASFYYFTTTFVTTSTIVATGSNQLGDTVDDIQTLIGTVNISGSLIVTGSTFLTASNVAGGQDNYIALWDGNNVLTTGSLYETGSNILVGTTTNPNTNFKLYVSGNIGSPSFQISSISSSNNLNYVGIWRPSGSTGYTNFLETNETASKHKWVLRGMDGFGSKRWWSENQASIFNINLGWNSPSITSFTGSTLLIDPHINVTNGNAAMVRGIYYNPTISASVNTNHIAIETTTGSILFKNLPSSNTISNVLLYDTVNGQLYYTASNGIGGGGSVSVTGSNATGSFTNQSIWNFNHGLNNQYVLVQTYDTNWSQIIPESITLTDINNVTITFPTSESGYAIAMLGGDASVSITGSLQEILNASVVSNEIIGNVGVDNALILREPDGENGLYIYGSNTTPNKSTWIGAYGNSTTPPSPAIGINENNLTIRGLQEITSSNYIITYSGNSQNGTISYISSSIFATTGSNTFRGNQTISGSLNISSSITASIISATDNGNGTNFKVGDDIWLGDINTADTLGLKGQQNATKAYIKFGSGISNPVLGSGGTNTLELTGSFALASGSVTITTGSITMPNRPAFSVYGSGITNNLTTTQNGDGTLNSNNYTVIYSQGNGFDSSTGIFTAPIAGLYQVTVIGRNSGYTGGISQLSVFKNNSNAAGNVLMIEWAPSSTMNHAGGSKIFKLAVNDTLRLIVSAGQINFDGNDNWSVAYIG